MARVYRFNVNFSEGAYVTLESLAREKGISKAEVIRDALSLEKWFADAQKEGSRILVERPDGSLREVIPR